MTSGSLRRTTTRLAVAWSVVAMLLSAAGAVVLVAGPALAVGVPTEAPTAPPSELPVDPLPSDAPTQPPAPPTDPSPSPSPTATPTQDPTTAPTEAPTTEPTQAPPSPAASPSAAPPAPASGSAGGGVLPQTTVPPVTGGVDAPQVAPPSGGGGAVPLPARTLLVTTADGLPGALGGVFVLAFAAVLGGLASSFTTFTLTNRGALVAHTLTGEIDMERTRRTRTAVGVALLTVAGLIGLVGYLRISTETLVPVQVVYLASAGFGVVVFAIAGGSLLVAETLRADERRVRELEAAVTTLATHLAGQVQEPPRLIERARPGGGAAGADAAADAAADPVAADAPDDVAPPEPEATADGAGDDAGPPTQTTTRIRRVRRTPPDA